MRTTQRFLTTGLGLIVGLFTVACGGQPAAPGLTDAATSQGSDTGPETTNLIADPDAGREAGSEAPKANGAAEAGPDVTGTTLVSEVGAESPGDLGGSLPPADNECLGQALSVEDAQGLCQWGTSVLGPEGTAFRAACLDIHVDAGAPPPSREASMVDMVVLSQATCVARIRGSSSSPCVYTVGQFKLGVNAFRVGDCGPGAAMALVGYMSASDGGIDARQADADSPRAPDGAIEAVRGVADAGVAVSDARVYQPGFALSDPFLSVTTVRDPTLPLVLKATQSGPGAYTFDAFFKDRALGESAIRGLVTLTDMSNGAAIPYTIGTPVRDSTTARETLALTPVATLAANGWYRVTVYPGETQELLACITASRLTAAWASPTPLTAADVTDFYTYSRPMVEQVLIADKGGKGYLDFLFTEALSADDLASYPMAEIAVDGVALSGCVAPYPCSASSTGQPYDIRLDLQTVPTSFGEITLRVPHGAKGVKGGTIRDGTVGNRHATLDGDWAVYTFKAADMVLTDNNMVRRWYYAAN